MSTAAETPAMTDFRNALAPALPQDGTAGVLAGRVWRPDRQGPSVAAIRAEGVVDITAAFPTLRDLCEQPDPAAALGAAGGENLGELDAILANTPPDRRDDGKPWLLAPFVSTLRTAQ